jgi:hypothetical protein
MIFTQKHFKEIFRILDIAANQEWKIPTDIGHGIIVAPQLPEGKSQWAKWVRDGDLESTNIYWAFVPNEETQTTWLAVKVYVSEELFGTFNLTTRAGQSELSYIEKRVFLWLENKELI